MTGLFFETARERDDRIARERAARVPQKPRDLVCDDAPVSTIETMAEVHARLRTRRQVGEPRWDAREIARSALGELPDRARAEFLTDLLCEMRGGTARQLLCEARNRITCHLHELIAVEYDAETAGLPPGTAAALARAQ